MCVYCHARLTMGSSKISGHGCRACSCHACEVVLAMHAASEHNKIQFFNSALQGTLPFNGQIGSIDSSRQPVVETRELPAFEVPAGTPSNAIVNHAGALRPTISPALDASTGTEAYGDAPGSLSDANSIGSPTSSSSHPPSQPPTHPRTNSSQVHSFTALQS